MQYFWFPFPQTHMSFQIVHQLSIEDVLRGSDYDPKRDEQRLGEGYRRTFEVMKDGHWRTPQEIAELSGCRLDSALRFVRLTKKFGHTVNKEYVDHGIWKYQIVTRNS